MAMPLMAVPLSNVLSAILQCAECNHDELIATMTHQFSLPDVAWIMC